MGPRALVLEVNKIIMAKQYKKLELVWKGKGEHVLQNPETGKWEFSGNDPVPPRPLIEIETFGDERGKSFDSEKSNLLIYGENLFALQSLLPYYAGKIKLIYLDPPFNRGKEDKDFETYNDNFAHSVWLSMMRERLKIMWKLLSPNGSIYIHLDWNEVHYAKVMMDEIFRRGGFQREIIWRIGWVSGYKTRAKNYIRNHDTILFYTKHSTDFAFNKEKAYTPYTKGYKRRDGSLPKGKGYPFEDTWNVSEIDKLDSIQIKSFSKEKTGFFTQKNEDLLKRIIEVSSNKGDLVLDAFAGAGTTGRVAHKLKRRWIMIETKVRTITKYALPRLKKIIKGDDPTGITKETNWKGGGGFRFLQVGAPLLIEDAETQLTILNPRYTNGPLTRAVCAIEGFLLTGDKILHGRNENHFAHVTEDFVDSAYAYKVAKKLPNNASLTIYALRARKNLRLPPRVKIKRMNVDLVKPYLKSKT